MKTHILMVLDESGSMASQVNDVVGGYNTFMKEQKSVSSDECIVSVIKFNSSWKAILSAAPISDVPELTANPGFSNSYVPNGSTALYDAVFQAITDGDKSGADRILCVVITDGEENASKEIKSDVLLKMMRDREELPNWTFVYLGVDPQKWSKQTGMSLSNSRSFNSDRVSLDFARITSRSRAYRMADSLSVKEGFMDEEVVEQPIATGGGH